MDSADEGHLDVTMTPPEDVQRNHMEPVPLPSPDEGEGNEITSCTVRGEEPREVRKVVTFGAHDLRVAIAYISSTRRRNLLHLHTAYYVFVLNVSW
jgi:hypothetical protein